MGKPKQKFDTSNESPSKVQELGNRKKFHQHDLHNFQPKTENQKKFLTAFYSQIPLILQKGSAGTGKSTLAMYAALSEVFDETSEYKKLIIIRSAVETRSIGFLPGDVHEKMEPYEAPFRDIVSNLMKYNDPYDNLKALGYLEFMLTSFVRGQTFDNTIIILDEAQNMDEKELLSVMTRIGVHSKMVLCGDSKQDDLFRQKNKSGFHYLEALFNRLDSKYSSVIEYGIDDIVRSELVKQILIADEKINGKN